MNHIQTLTNRVDLSLQDYLDLYEFRKKLEENNVAIINWTGYHNGSYQTKYVVLSDALKEIEITNKKLSDSNQKLNEENIKLNGALNDLAKKIPVENKPLMTLDDVKRMSIWEFLRWKKKKGDVLDKFPNLK